MTLTGGSEPMHSEAKMTRMLGFLLQIHTFNASHGHLQLSLQKWQYPCHDSSKTRNKSILVRSRISETVPFFTMLLV
jgi:hypothetical protein